MDDNGTKPKKDTDVILLFEPSGKALLYVQNLTDMLAHHGTWKFDKGVMRLRFQAEELNVDSVFPLDLNQEKVTMPFRIFSEGKGSSQWVRRIIRIEYAVHMVFRGAVIDETQRLTADEAITRTVEFARGLIDIYHKRKISNFPHFQLTKKLLNISELLGGTPLLYAQEDILWPFEWLKHIPVETSPLKNGVKLKYMDSCEIDWYDGLFNKAKDTGVVPKISDGFPWDSIKEELVKNDYKIEELKNENATVENLVKRLYLETPGVVIIHTHGTSSESLATGEMLSETGDPEETEKKLEPVKE